MTAPQMPPSRRMRTPGLDYELHVLEGRIELKVPFRVTVLRPLFLLGIDITYQACSQTECFPPAQARLAMALTGVDVIRKTGS